MEDFKMFDLDFDSFLYIWDFSFFIREPIALDILLEEF